MDCCNVSLLDLAPRAESNESTARWRGARRSRPGILWKLHSVEATFLFHTSVEATFLFDGFCRCCHNLSSVMNRIRLPQSFFFELWNLHGIVLHSTRDQACYPSKK